MKTLYLARHGETLFNTQHRMQGWCDSPLTERGVEQARELGRILRERGVRVDHAYCSTAERAADTLELVLNELMGPVSADPAALAPGQTPVALPYTRLKNLREVSYGNLEAQPDYLSAHGAQAARTYYLQFGGEATDDTLARMVETLTWIMRQPDHDQVLVVSHGAATFNFLRAIQDPAAELAAGWGNCTTAVYTFDDTRADEAPDGAGAGPFTLEEVIRLPS